ncbi:MAG TPA: SBBP repeat-containing protein, partial [Solirubrobacterales bacterium]|nr:SBBP repeat-containing protein [Solirubrobacterales bacterium]
GIRVGSARDGRVTALIPDMTVNPGSTSSAEGIAADSAGNIYVVGTVFGDGTDGLTVKYSPAGDLLWQDSWDGPPEAPYSLDYFRRVLIDPAGNPVVVGYGITGEHDLLEDVITTRYAAPTGAILWRRTYGGPGRDIPAAMVMDAQGAVYITGEDNLTGTTGRRAFTVKYTNDGTEAWVALDQGGARDTGTSLALTPGGLVATAIASDPDFNVSNFNENWFIVGRDRESGSALWQFRYGDNCVRCYDVPQHMVATSAGRLHAAGKTNSAPYENDLILFELDAATGAELRRGTIDPGPTYTAGVLSLALDASENLYLSGSVNNPDLRFLAARFATGFAPVCYANCDSSTAPPVLNVLDFNCFLNRFAAGEPSANCDGSTAPPTLNVLDFNCFLSAFGAGCP